MKKILFAVLFAFVTVSFSACDNNSASEGETTDTTAVTPIETAPDEVVTPVDSTSTDTTTAN